MNQYMYDGPVMEFDTCVANRWQGSTYAASEKKARSNLVYQFKKKTNRIPSTSDLIVVNYVQQREIQGFGTWDRT